MAVDLVFKYDIGDIVKFNLTLQANAKELTGLIGQRWSTSPNVLKDQNVYKIYKIYCLEKQLMDYSILEELIIRRA